MTGIPKDFGGSGDPSPYTAHGVLMGIKASAQEKLGTSDLKGMRIAVQGLGNVGSNLVKYLSEHGAIVSVADINQKRVADHVNKFGVKAIHPDQILFEEC
ncbi:MAG: NAD-binding protein, partial [Pseudobdellovibrionaceae bacterium]